MASDRTSEDSRCEMTMTVRPCGDAPDVVVDDGLTVGIERAGRLVEDEDARIEDQRAGNREPLPLAAGKVGRTLVDMRLVAARKPVDELLGAGQARHPHDLVEGRVRLGGGNVLADRSREQEVLLQHDAEIATQMRDVVFAHVDTVDLDQPLVVGMKALQQPRHRRLAGAAAADNAERPADRHLEAHAVERVASAPEYLKRTRENST